MKKWKCLVCGQIVESETCPSECPLCHAPGDKFVEVKEDGEASRFYTIGDDRIVRTLMMLTHSAEGETTAITLDGNMLREDLENLIAKVADSQ